MCDNTTIFNTSCSKVETRQYLAYSPLFLLGLLVNAAALRVLIAQRSSWTDTHIYVLNLVVADSAFIIFLPFRIYDAFYCLSRKEFCSFLISLHYVNMYVSIFTSVAISVHRYLAVQFPLKTRSWRKKKQAAVVVCLGIWVFVVTVCVIFKDNNSPDKLWTCFERCRDRPLQLGFILLMVCAGYLVPLLIITFCSSRIIYILSKEERKSEKMKNTINIVTANMLVFIMCYTPVHIRFVVSRFSEDPLNWKKSYVEIREFDYLFWTEWTASSNCFFDSVSYYFLLKRFYSKSQNWVSHFRNVSGNRNQVSERNQSSSTL